MNNVNDFYNNANDFYNFLMKPNIPRKDKETDEEYHKRIKRAIKPKLTNYEKIKAMSIDEMAEFLVDRCGFCVFYKDDSCRERDCLVGHKQWLESEGE